MHCGKEYLGYWVVVSRLLPCYVNAIVIYKIAFMKNLHLDSLTVHNPEKLAANGFQSFHSKDVLTETGCIHRVLLSTLR